MKKLSEDTGIDPVPPKYQAEQADPYFNRLGEDRNAKFVEQRFDDDKPVGSHNGEYVNDDENADLLPAKEAVLHQVPVKK